PLHEAAETLRAEVFPRQPELQGTEAACSLHRVLVPVQPLVLRPFAPVVLRRPMERLRQVVAPANEQAPDVVGLEEPLVWIDGDRVRAVKRGDPARVARR